MFQTSLVAIEPCASSQHYWARTLLALVHQVKVLPTQHPKAFVLHDKTDAMDAQTIWGFAKPAEMEYPSELSLKYWPTQSLN